MAEEVFLSRPLLSAIGEARNRQRLPGGPSTFAVARCCPTDRWWEWQFFPSAVGPGDLRRRKG